MRFFILIVAISFYSCSDKSNKVVENKKVVLSLLFNTILTDNSDGGTVKYNSKIALSDSIFIQKEYIMAHSAGYYVSDSIVKFLLKGKIVDEKVDFEYIVDNFNLNLINLKYFITIQSYLADNKHFHDEEIKSLKKIFGKDLKEVKRLNNGDVIQYVDFASDQNTINILSKKQLFSFQIKSSSELDKSFIKLYDITGDGDEEIFVFSPKSSYWGQEWLVEVYRII